MNKVFNRARDSHLCYIPNFKTSIPSSQNYRKKISEKYEAQIFPTVPNIKVYQLCYRRAMQKKKKI